VKSNVNPCFAADAAKLLCQILHTSFQRRV
jgi:hypothetical protein